MLSIDFRVDGMNGKYARDIEELKEGLRVEFYGFNDKDDLGKFALEKLKQIKKSKFIGRYSVDTRELTYTIVKYKRK